MAAESIKHICDGLLEATVTAAEARSGLKRIEMLVSEFPDSELVATTYAVIRERTRQSEGMLELWEQLYSRFPDSFQIVRFYVRWLIRSKKQDRAAQVIAGYQEAHDAHAERAVEAALLFYEARDYQAGDDLFQQLVSEHPDRISIRTQWAQRLKGRGKLLEAVAVMSPVSTSTKLNASAKRLLKELGTIQAVLSDVGVDVSDGTHSMESVALRESILRFCDRTPRSVNAGQVGRVAFITGGLGSGGAERQLSRTVSRLERLRQRGEDVGEISLSGPFDVVVKSHSGDNGNDFFLNVLQRAGVETFQVNDMPVRTLDELGVADPVLQTMFSMLPSSARYGIQRMVGYFRDRQTDVAYLWQDGAVLFGVLAALIAGVPRIVICLRGLPPNLRKERFRPEYEDMYSALARVPNVRFAANTRSVSAAYSDWLGIPMGDFHIVPNGVDKLRVRKASEAEAQQWAEFDDLTADATATIGSVFRFEAVKRPLLWIKFAETYLQEHPRTRFVLVGGGTLLGEAQELAEKKGLSERILFVGNSNNVGMWLEKLDTFVLLSRYEGLPNVLVEAQRAGVGVVSTPAGGACDVFQDGLTGHALSCSERPCVDEICGKVFEMVQRTQSGPDVGRKAASMASRSYSTKAMLESTVSLLSDPLKPAALLAGE